MDINDFKEEAQNVYCFRFYNKDLTEVVPKHLHPREFNKIMQKFYKTYREEIKTKSIKSDKAYQRWIEKLKNHNQYVIDKSINYRAKKKFDILVIKQSQLEHLITYLDFNDIKTFFNISYNVGLKTKELVILKELDYIYLDENNSYKCNYNINEVFDIAFEMLREVEKLEMK